eukprot:CAMPEP_0117736844 /NCGR_PEP_ID=MMETSP0947-20121206/2179_1 /TAXON_ID=44440 /ORGANISM="Chattonella subsalsa, Strain CCMP2191" /LENGTH=324 /DNA_ID=CAMNT_0005552227 /DNA_START=389 /DNA_END=1359 /DNA_ORIENTATION=+
MDQADGWCRPNQDAMVELLALLGNQTCALLGMYILTKPVWVMLLKEDNTSRRQQIFRILLCNLCGFFLSQFSFDTLIVLDVFKLKLSLTSSDVGVYARISYAVQVICTNISFRDFDVLSSCPKCQCWDRTGKWGKEYQKTSDSKIQKRSAQKKVKVLPFVISCDIARYCPQSPNTANIMNTSLSTKNSKPAKQRKESLKFSNVINVSSLKTSFAAGNSIESIFQNPALTAELHSLTAKRFCPEVSLFLEAGVGYKEALNEYEHESYWNERYRLYIDIVETFIKNNAEQEINVSSGMKKDIECFADETFFSELSWKEQYSLFDPA